MAVGTTFGLSPAAIITLVVGIGSAMATLAVVAVRYGKYRGRHKVESEQREEDIEEHDQAIGRIEEKVDGLSDSVEEISEEVDGMRSDFERNSSRLARQNHTIHDVILDDDETCSDPYCEWCHGYRATSSSVESQRPNSDDPSAGD